MTPRPKSVAGRLLAMLRTGPKTTKEVAVLGHEYRQGAASLRKQGYIITVKQVAFGNTAVYRYTLVSEPEDKRDDK